RRNSAGQSESRPRGHLEVRKAAPHIVDVSVMTEVILADGRPPLVSDRTRRVVAPTGEAVVAERGEAGLDWAIACELHGDGDAAHAEERAESGRASGDANVCRSDATSP